METVPVLTHNVPVVEYEYLDLSFGRDTDRSMIRRALTDHAEYGRWELERTRIYVGGRTRTRLRRRIIRPRRSLSHSL